MAGGGRMPVWSFAFSVYLLTASFAVPYYNWQFAKDHGFREWLMFGELVPSAKALIWPYFAFRSAPPRAESAHDDSAELTAVQKSEMALRAAIQAINYSQQATYLLNASANDNIWDNPGLSKILELRVRSRDAAKSVDVETLDHIYPEFGTRFHDDFLKALTLFIEGCQKHSNQKLQEFLIANDRWADWFTENRKQIENASNRATGR